jgi:Putative peptidoglycan binding domain
MARTDIVTIGDLNSDMAVHPAFGEMAGPQVAGFADVIDPLGAFRRRFIQDDFDQHVDMFLQSPNPYAGILDDAAPSAMEGLGDDPGPPPSETGPDGTPTDTSTIVAWAQQALTALSNRLGNASFNPLGVDGIVGPKTTAAVTAFQAWAGITVDGLIGPQTTGALASKLAASSGGNVFPVGPKIGNVPVVPIAIGVVALVGLALYLKRRRR